MKKTLLPLLFLFTGISLFSQVPKPAKPAFMITYQENGKNINETWTYNATIKFSLSNWNNWYYENGYKPANRKQLLEFDPSLFLKLEPGTVIKFYPCEIDESGSGSGGSYTRLLTTDGVETVTETEQSTGTHTIITTDADYRNEHNIPTNEVYCLNARYYQLGDLAELERTETGAILYAYAAVGNNLSEWAVNDETMQQVFPEAEKFVLTDKDIMAWQQISRTNVRSGSYEDDNLTVKLTIKMEVPLNNNPEVTIDGCSELGIGEQGQVTAHGKPEGGTYRFRVEPSGILSVSSGGASATLTGSSPGRGNLYVEYTTPEGKAAEASKTAACVKLNSYNGGAPVPQIALYDIDGKKINAIKEIPVSVDPSDAGELLSYIPADPAILTALNLGENIDLQGIRQGKTTLQAQTSCGGKTGPAVEVEVVNCDDETKAKLEEMMKIAEEGRKEAYEEIARILDSEEFNEAADNIEKSTIELAEKTALTIAASGKNEGGVESAVKIAEAFATIKDLVTSHTSEDLNFNELTGMMKATGSHLFKAVAGNLEIIKASSEFGKQLGTLIGTDIELQNAMRVADEANRRVQDIVKLQNLCRGSSEKPGSQKEPPAKSQTDSGKADKTTGKNQDESAGQQNTDNPVTQQGEDEDATDGGEVSPPPPVSEPRNISLPYTGGDNCGCTGNKNLKADAEGFSSLQAGMQNLQQCVDSFTKGPLAEYSLVLGEWQGVLSTLEGAVNAGPEEFKKSAGNTAAKIDSLIVRTKTYDTAGNSFLKEFNKCPGSVNSVTDILKSAYTVTVNDLKTNY